jgi:hypothetical protein
VVKTTARKQKKSAGGWTQLRLEDSTPTSPPPPAERAMPPYQGEFVAALVADLVAELGDATHTTTHQAEAAALWRRSGLPEAQFAKVLWEVRGRLKRRPATRQGAGSVRVAAFFVLLRDWLGLVEEPGPGTPARRPAGPPPFLRKR